MSRNTHTKEYQEIVQISNTLYNEYLEENSIWKNSPFAWIKQRPSRTIGAIGEKIIASWLSMHDFSVSRSPDSDADRIVENKRVEIKFSTLWENGSYRFQQIRNQNYDFIIMLGISPDDAHCWVLKKEDVIRLWQQEHAISSQHGGATGSDTSWVTLTPANDFAPLAPFGNSLRSALQSIAALTGYTPKTLTSCFDEQ